MNDPLERLAPPPGGLQALRARLDREETLPGWGLLRPRMAAAVAAALALAVAGYLLVPAGGPPPATDYGIFQRYMESPREEVRLVDTDESGLRLVPQATNNPQVRLYWIEESASSESEG